jgi:hypothetical protein
VVTPTLRVDLSDVERAFGSLERRARALGPVFRELVKPMRDDQRDHGAKGEGPDGKWPQRASSTIQKMRATGRRRRPMGRIPQSMDYRAGDFGVTGVGRVPWENAHATGARVGRGAKLPVRIVHWLSDELVTRARGRIERALVEAFGGR